MSTTPRVSSAIPGESAHFASVLAHQPEIAASFFALYGRFWGSNVLAARIKEVARMRNARVTECGFCRNVRFDTAVAQGLGEDVVDHITDGYQASDKLTPAEKASLTFTDALIHDPELLTGDARAALLRHLTPAQIAELGLEAAAIDDSALGDGTRLCVAYARRIPLEHTAITDAEAAAVAAHLGKPGFVAFSVVAALADAKCRAALVDLPGLVGA